MVLGTLSVPAVFASADVAEPFHRVDAAAAAFEQGQGGLNIRIRPDGGVGLYDAELVEDDGPGIGSDADWLRTDRAPVTELSGDLMIKKVLRVDRPEAISVHLVFPAGAEATINGKPVPSGESPSISPSWLKPGDNEILLRAPAGARVRAKYASRDDIRRNAPDRRDAPARSFRSDDGGRTWTPVDGEYMVRLHLTHHSSFGRFTGPVVDLGGELEAGPLLQPRLIRAISVTGQFDTPPGTRIAFRIRTGDTPVPEPAHWTDWREVEVTPQPGNRFLQWEAALETRDPLVTPVLHLVTVDASVSKPAPPAWTSGSRVGGFHNETIVSTSLPFEYEDPLTPRLVELRRKYKLDEVVAGAQSETEQMVRLRDWVAHQWKFKAPEENYPPFDADAIIRQGGGFCVQYAVTLMQCALSLGHQARFVFGHNPGAFDGGGHEVCEIWSDEHRKWVFHDVNQNWIYTDRKTGVPMSMLEVHDLVAKTYYPGRISSPENAPQIRTPSDALALCYGPTVTPNEPPAEFSRHFTNGQYTVPTRWLFTRYLPRNNYLAKPHPVPKTQGTHWDWSDYICWEDSATPRHWLYRNFTARRADVAWTLNQVRFSAEPSGDAGVLFVRMGTFTPHFGCFMVAIDGTPAVPTAGVYAWTLHPGHNRISMRARNTSGVYGCESFLEVNYTPGG
jgi:transglutaminase-like putative cysteine protease